MEHESIPRAMTDFLVKRDDLRECRIAESPEPAIEDGQALLRVGSFGLTANNVTYAVFGEAMSYWDFFPAGGGWGRVPMWGFAEVERSEAENVEPGTRLFGYLPPSSHLVVAPVDAGEGGFVDASPHRAALPSAYHRYLATAADPFYRPETETIQMLLRPLFFTSFLIDDQLADDGLADRGPILISSASSKTAIAAAFLLARRDGVELVGLTSSANRAFVESLAIYDRVVTYGDVGLLEVGPATFVDTAGDGAVRLAVHSRYGDALVHSMAVGATHWEELGAGAGDLPGPAPTFFFAPDRVSKRSEDWGRAGLESRVADAWHPFCEWIAGWLEPIHGEGFEALRDAYLEVLEGRADPKPPRAHALTGSLAAASQARSFERITGVASRLPRRRCSARARESCPAGSSLASWRYSRETWLARKTVAIFVSSSPGSLTSVRASSSPSARILSSAG
jgi:hypothetical protein